MNQPHEGLLTDTIGAGVALIVLSGEHDIASAPAFEAEVEHVDGAVVVDFSECTFMDSSIVAVLIRHCPSRNGLAGLAIVMPPDGFPARVLGILGLDQILPVYETRAEALHSLSR